MKGVARRLGGCCHPSGMVASLQEGQSRTQGHSAGEGCGRSILPKHNPRGAQPCPPQTQPSGAGEGSRTHLSPAAAAPILGGTHSGCQALGTQCTEGQPGSTRHCHHKAALHPLSAAACPAVVGHRPRDPPRGTGTHRLPCHSPWGDEDVERFRGTVGAARGRMGAGCGLTSP